MVNITYTRVHTAVKCITSLTVLIALNFDMILCSEEFENYSDKPKYRATKLFKILLSS